MYIPEKHYTQPFQMFMLKINKFKFAYKYIVNL